MKLSERMRDRVEFDGNSPLEETYVMWIRQYADEVAELEEENEALREDNKKLKDLVEFNSALMSDVY